MRWIVVFLALLLSANPAFGLRCGGRIIKEGGSTAKLIKYRGEPTTRFLVERRVFGDVIFFGIWAYNFGSSAVYDLHRS